MNVIVSNVNKEVFAELNVDILKTVSGEFSVEEIIQSFSNFFYNRMFLDITAIKGYTDIKNIQKLSIALDVSKIILLLGDNPIVNSNVYKSKLVSMGFYNFTTDITGLKYLYDNPNSYKDVASYQEMDNNISSVNVVNSVNETVPSTLRVIGFKNVSLHAGATSLIYMMKKELSSRYKVVAIEVNKKDFLYFNDKDMISVSEKDLGNTIFKHKSADIILVDLNDANESVMDGDVYYLIEPSTIKINKMLLTNKNTLAKLANKKVILNISLLSESDIKDFEKEANLNVFYNLGPMSDKVDNSNILLPFLEKLGLIKRVDNGENKKSNNKLFGFLKF